MTRALRAEWTKLRTVHSTGWALGLALVLMVLLSALAGAESETSGCAPGGRCDNDTVADSLGGVYFGQFAIIALGVMAMGSEYGTGLIRMTFVAEPRRRLVLLAKGIAVGGAVLVVGLLASVLMFEIASSLLRGNGFNAEHGYREWSLTDPEVLRAVGGTGVYLAAVALLSLGIAALLRHTAAAISTVTALLVVPVFAASLLPEHISDRVLQTSPMTAGLAIQRTVERSDSVPIDQWVGLGVACLWALAAVAAALWVIGRRDA
jgi:ABC-2 type transport system permease protein